MELTQAGRHLQLSGRIALAHGRPPSPQTTPNGGKALGARMALQEGCRAPKHS